MARIPFPDLASPSGDIESLLVSIQGQRGGRLPNLYRMLLHSTPLAGGWLNLLTAVRYKSSLDGSIREMVICLIARLNEAEYEWQSHAKLAGEEGLSDAQLAALPNWRGSGLFDARHSAALAYAERMTREIDVDDETFAAVREHFEPRQLLELTVTIAAYNMVSRVLVALQIDLDQD